MVIRRKWPLAVLLVFVLLPLLTLTPLSHFLYFNWSGSEPVGVYRAVAAGPFATGDMVVMRVPEAAGAYAYGRGWLREGELLLKTVYALPGEAYSVTDSGVFTSHAAIQGMLIQDGTGQALPRLRGEFTVREEHFLPLATGGINSFDGRYFGDVPMELIVCKVVPVITWRGATNL